VPYLYKLFNLLNNVKKVFIRVSFVFICLCSYNMFSHLRKVLLNQMEYFPLYTYYTAFSPQASQRHRQEALRRGSRPSAHDPQERAPRLQISAQAPKGVERGYWWLRRWHISPEAATGSADTAADAWRHVQVSDALHCIAPSHMTLHSSGVIRTNLQLTVT
jgi:hypothetical protein